MIPQQININRQVMLHNNNNNNKTVAEITNKKQNLLNTEENR